MTTRITATLLLAASLAGGITPTAAEAESRYVSDELEITMRVGASTKQRIISMLESGTEVEVLSVDSKSGYSKVRAPNGKVGFVLTRFLMDEPSARDQLETLNARIQELEAEPEQIRSRLNQLQEDYAKLQKDHQKVVNDKNAITQELAGIRQTAANAINISNERTELRKQLVALKQQVADLQHTNRELSNNRDQNWFMIGAGVVLGSIFIGWLLPYLRFKRRRTSRWSEI
jgi:SH3 domain protein